MFYIHWLFIYLIFKCVKQFITTLYYSAPDQSPINLVTFLIKFTSSNRTSLHKITWNAWGMIAEISTCKESVKLDHNQNVILTSASMLMTLRAVNCWVLCWRVSLRTAPQYMTTQNTFSANSIKLQQIMNFKISEHFFNNNPFYRFSRYQIQLTAKIIFLIKLGQDQWHTQGGGFSFSGLLQNKIQQ